MYIISVHDSSFYCNEWDRDLYQTPSRQRNRSAGEIWMDAIVRNPLIKFLPVPSVDVAPDVDRLTLTPLRCRGVLSYKSFI